MLESQHPLTFAAIVESISRVDFQKGRIFTQSTEFDASMIPLGNHLALALFDECQLGFKLIQCPPLRKRGGHHYEPKRKAARNERKFSGTFYGPCAGLKARQLRRFHSFSSH